MARDRLGKIARVAACGVVGASLAASPAFAALPLKDSVYRGTLGGSQSKISISLRTSSGGGEVQGLHISALPIYCPGNGPPGTPTIVFAKARISASGRFSSAGKDMISSGPLKGSVVATLKLSGTFTAGGGVHGTITTIYGGSAKSCGGHSSYTAHG
jgi:hypothetical protein